MVVGCGHRDGRRRVTGILGEGATVICAQRAGDVVRDVGKVVIGG